MLLAAACAPESTGVPVGLALRDSAETGDTAAPAGLLAPALSMSVLASGLADPFEMIVGPDGYLWITERTSGVVSRISTADGSRTIAVTIPDVLITPGTQDGLMGMALDPGLGRGIGREWVYVAYTYDADPTATVLSKVQLVRYDWDVATHTLSGPVVLISGLPGSTDHNSGRLLIGPDHKMYYTIGDQGNNQLSRACIANQAQTLPTARQIKNRNFAAYQGKTLRLNLDGSIPRDNPVINGVRSHIYTWGHRNAQGLVFGRDGVLYAAEQGPKSDDEVDILTPGKNYGWPDVAGHQDDLAYVYANWSASVNPPCSSLAYSDLSIPPSVPQQAESAWADPAFQGPARTFFTVPDNFDFTDADCDATGMYFICWPTIAPSSIATYEGHPNAIPALEDSLLLTSLKLGTLYRVDLHDAAGNPMPDNGDPTPLFNSVDRYRRITVSPDGSALYVSTDVSGWAMGADGHPTTTLEHPGDILVLTAGP
jgi:PQQ-dependent dehydrogenase (s-GDH family)